MKASALLSSPLRRAVSQRTQLCIDAPAAYPFVMNSLSCRNFGRSEKGEVAARTLAFPLRRRGMGVSSTAEVLASAPALCLAPDAMSRE